MWCLRAVSDSSEPPQRVSVYTTYEDPELLTSFHSPFILSILSFLLFSQAQHCCFVPLDLCTSSANFSVDSRLAHFPFPPTVTCATALLPLHCNASILCVNGTVVSGLSLAVLETQIILPGTFKIYHSN